MAQSGKALTLVQVGKKLVLMLMPRKPSQNLKGLLDNFTTPQK